MSDVRILGHALIKPVVPKVLETVLMLIRETVNDDLNGVIQRLITYFEDDIAQYAVNIAHHLAETFRVVLERDDDENVEDRAMTAMGLLNTIESMVNVLEENKPIMQQLEPVVLNIVGYVLQNNSQGICSTHCSVSFHQLKLMNCFRVLRRDSFHC